MHASFSFHQSTLTTSIHHTSMYIEFKTCVMQANIWNAYSNATYKFMSLLPYLCAQILILSPYFHSSPILSSFPYLCFSPPIFVNYFSPFVINDHKGLILDRLRLSMSIDGVRIIFPNLVQSIIFAKDI